MPTFSPPCLRRGAVFVTADGQVHFEGSSPVQAHEHSALAACAHPSGSGVVTTSDDGRVVWSRPTHHETVAELPGKWIDSVAAAPASGLIAFATGREVHVRDTADEAFARSFGLERACAGLAFEPKGRRLAAATYGGAALIYARVSEQVPQMLKWGGQPRGGAVQPGRQVPGHRHAGERAARLAPGGRKDMRMSGYPPRFAASPSSARAR